MQPRRKMSRQGLELLKSFEGLRLTAARLPDGRWTMGHGHTQYAREGATITAADAEALLLYDLIPVTAAVNEAVTVDISQNQFDALVCFAFNVGVEAFRQSDVLSRVNQERMTEAALAMAIWRSGAFEGRRVVLDALVRRRSAENALMLGEDIPPTPSDLVRPEIDPAAEASLPPEPPSEVEIDFGSETAQARPTGDPATQSEAEPAAPHMREPVEEPTDASILTARNRGAESSATPDEATPISAGPEPIAAISEPAPPLVASATLSATVFAAYPPEPFAPLQAAEPEAPAITAVSAEEPAVTSDTLEPPLVLVLTPPPEVPTEPAGAAPAPEPVAAESSDVQVPLFTPEVEVPAGDEEAIYFERQDEGPRKRGWSEVGAYVTTGLVGLAAFGFGVAGFQRAEMFEAPPGEFNEIAAIAWVLVAIGATCVWISAYNLFKRLGGPEPE